MLADLFLSKVNVVTLILRFGLAAIFIVHGYVKLSVTSELAPSVMSMTTQRAVGWLEFLSGVFLFVGLCTRIAASILIVLQIAAIVLVSWKYALEVVRITPTGGDYALVGPEYNLVLVAMCLCLLVLGAGAVSLDRLIVTLWMRRKAEVAKTTAASDSPTPSAPTAVPAPRPGKAEDKSAGSVQAV